jgi:MFS family permease
MSIRRLSDVRSQWQDEPWRSTVARFSVSRMISVTGTRVSWIALVAVIYARTGSGAWISAALVVQFGVFAVSAPWTGAIGDRFDRRRVMIASDLAAALAFVGIAFAHSPLLLVVLAGVASVAEAPFGPASSAFLVMLVPEEQRARATASRAAASSIGIILGGMIGGILVAALGGTIAFLVNSASFVFSALLVLSIRGDYRAAPSTDPSHAGVWAGVRLIGREPALRLVIAANGAALVGYGMINIAEFPLFALLGSGAIGFGIATAGFGIGQFTGSRLGRRADGARREKYALLLGWFVGGITLFACGLIPSNLAVILLFSISGVGSALAGVATTLVLQRHAPDAVRARVFAASGSVNIGAIVIAMIVGGALIGSLGAVMLCVVCGVVTLLALGPSWLLPPRGGLPRKPEEDPVRDPQERRPRWLLAT